MKKLFRVGILSLSGAMFAVIFLLALLLYSPKFNQWLVFKMTTMVPELTIINAEGLLLGEMHFQGLKYQADQADINMDSGSYRLNLAGLLTQQIQFEYLHASGIDVVIQESTEPEKQASEAMTFVMPVKLQVDDFLLENLRIRQNDTDYQIENISLAFLYQGQDIQLSEFSLDSEIVQLQGEARLKLESQLPFNVDLTVAKSVPDMADIKARLKLYGDRQKIYLDAVSQVPGKIHAEGWIKLNEESPRFDLSCAWPLLQWPLQGDKQYASENARFTLQGTSNDYVVSLESDIYTQELSTGALQLLGQGNTEQFTIKTLAIKALEGEVKSSGRVSWTEKIPSQLQLLAKNIQLSPFLAGYSSEINLDAHLSGKLVNDPDFSVEINQLEGQVLDKPLNAKAKVHYSPKQLFIKHLQANVGDNSLQAQGVVGEHSSVDFTLDAANLHELSPDLSGAAFAEGSLQGEVSHAVVQFNLLSDGLKFQQQQLGSLYAKGKLATAGAGQLDLNVNAGQMIFNGMEIDKIELQSIGQFAHHDLRAIVVSELGDTELAIQGAWHPRLKDWQGHIQQLKLNGKSTGRWQLIKVAPLAMKFARQESVQLETDLCLAQRDGTGLFCLNAESGQQQGQLLAGKIKQLPLSVFKYWLPEALQIDSYLEAKFSLQSQPDLQGELDLSLAPGSIKMDQEQSGLQIVQFEAVEVGAQLFSESLQSTMSIVLNDMNHMRGEVNVTGLQNTETANINGLLNIQLQSISFVDAFIDSVSDVAGEVKAQLVLQGLLTSPELKGSKVNLAQGKLFVQGMGLQVNDINIELSHSEQQQLALQGKAMIAEQQLVINGLVDQYINDQFNFKLSVKGDDLKLMQTPEMQFWVSPDLRLEGDKKGAKLEGDVTIPQAILRIESLPEGSVALSEDEVIITETKKEPKKPVYPLDAELKILLGESVSLEGFGLKTHLQGQLRAVRQNNQLKLFNKLNSVKGTYQAYGQDLTIEKGELLFNGDIENPGVNILASRRASDWEDKTIAYLRMTGTLKNPVTTIYTVPALTESESLAYLLTGAPLGKSGGSNATLLATAAMGLGRDYVDALMGVVGVDEFDMKSTSVGQNSMVIGKRISANLYARYIMDVLTAEMQFAVIYKLTKNISIETRAGTTHSSDIRYNIEFD